MDPPCRVPGFIGHLRDLPHDRTPVGDERVRQSVGLPADFHLGSQLHRPRGGRTGEVNLPCFNGAAPVRARRATAGNMLNCSGERSSLREAGSNLILQGSGGGYRRFRMLTHRLLQSASDGRFGDAMSPLANSDFKEPSLLQGRLASQAGVKIRNRVNRGSRRECPER